ncbi:unnamed protein product [Notodromas monacha]|uniref:Uncharacterized protein n=1 Tax=Notodromas monacha TaxID=399045 RepID=A0A7R9BDH0_9CRUS|nr:unnamed protein product [Notodromas monacha]CAG0913308.1 unnamed protein product [Notodromas monacha]
MKNFEVWETAYEAPSALCKLSLRFILMRLLLYDSAAFSVLDFILKSGLEGGRKQVRLPFLQKIFNGRK